jgi:hypothetical protein
MPIYSEDSHTSGFFGTAPPPDGVFNSCCQPDGGAEPPDQQKGLTMSTVTAKDGTEIYYTKIGVKVRS